MLDFIDPSTGVMFTTTPAEPILAHAAMRHFCKRMNWPTSIKTLTSDQLDRRAINKGMKGEPFSRLVLTLAHDGIAKRPPFCPIMPTFTVDCFLESLFNQMHHRALDDIDKHILNGT